MTFASIPPSVRSLTASATERYTKRMVWQHSAGSTRSSTSSGAAARERRMSNVEERGAPGEPDVSARQSAASATSSRNFVQLMIGLYEMSANNTPGIEKVLSAERLKSLPEAHCCLMRGPERFDFTGLPAAESSPFDSLIEERAVSPLELPRVKTAYHRQAIEAWAQRVGIDPDRAWAIRERCIAALAKQLD